MESKIIARNIIILEQLKELNQEFLKNNIKIILLKGISLIILFPDYIKSRIMEDIDLLVKPDEFKKVENILYSLGYKNVVYDPFAYYHPSKLAFIDIQTDIWYLNKKQNVVVWLNSLHLKDSLYTLSPYELYVYIYVHSMIHRQHFDNKWITDLQLLEDNFKLDITIIHKKLKKYFGRINLETKFSGHITRFIFLNFRKKIIYLFNTLFPSNRFIERRYNLKNIFFVFLYKFLRPVFLINIFFLQLTFNKPLKLRNLTKK